MATLKAIWLLATFLAIFDNSHGYLGDVLATSFFLHLINLGLFLQFFLVNFVFQKHLDLIYETINLKKLSLSDFWLFQPQNQPYLLYKNNMGQMDGSTDRLIDRAMEGPIKRWTDTTSERDAYHI